MQKSIRTRELAAGLAGLLLFVYAFARRPATEGAAAASGTVSFTVTTVSYDGEYADKNIGAIWIQDSQNRFVRTQKLWANKRVKNLLKWDAASRGNTTDAITGATIRSHQTHTVSWDCTDLAGAVVPDGQYTLLVEFTEDDSKDAGRPPGKWLAVEFTKGAADQTVQLPDQAYFKNVKLTYTVTGGGPQPARVSGVVSAAPDGSPLAGVLIELRQSNQVVQQTTSAGSGAYEMTGIQPGSYVLAASRSGYEPYSASLDIGDGADLQNQNITLQPVQNGATLSGLVRDAATNAPLAGASVQLQQGGRSAYTATSDAAGNFAISDIQPATYELSASAPGYSLYGETVTLQANEQRSGIDIALTATSDTTPPATPVQVTASQIGTENRVLVAWSANNEADLQGYRISFGTQTPPMQNRLDAGRNTQATISALDYDQTWYFAVTAFDTAGNESPPSAAVPVFVARPDTTQPPPEPATPAPAYNYPNPFRAGVEATTIRYTVENRGQVTITLHDLSNRLVKTVLNGIEKEPGTYTDAAWDGRDDEGRVIAVGIYYGKISTPGQTRYVKIAVIK